MQDDPTHVSFVTEFFDDLIEQGRDEAFEPVDDLASALAELRAGATEMNCVALRTMPSSTDKRHLSATVTLDEMERLLDRRRPSVLYVIEQSFDAREEMLDFDPLDEDALQFPEFAQALETWKVRDGTTCRAAIGLVMDGVLLQSFLVERWFLAFEDVMDETITEAFDEETESEPDKDEGQSDTDGHATSH